MKKTVHQTEQTKTYRRKPTPQTHHFGGDVGVRQVPVLAHDGQVTVDVDGQSVSSQDHDAAHAQTETHTGRDVRRYSTQVCRVEEQARSSPTHPFSPLLMNFCTSFTPRRMFFTLAAEEGDKSVVGDSSGGSNRDEMSQDVSNTSQTMQRLKQCNSAARGR